MASLPPEPDPGDGEVLNPAGEAVSAPPVERPEITRAPVTATAIGLAAGALSALLGVGGGLLMVPAMVLFLRVRQQRAHGTSLAVVLPAALAAAYRYHLAHRIEWDLVLPLTLGGVVGALIGAILANALRAAPVKRLFGLLIIFTGCLMIVVPGAAARDPSAIGSAAGGLVVGLVGLAAGILSGLLGVGGGTILVPAIVFLLGRDQHVAQGVSLAVIIPASISGAWIHARKGNVIPSLAFWLAAGAVVGATVVGYRVQSFSPEPLRAVFGSFLVVMGVSLAGRRAWKPSK